MFKPDDNDAQEFTWREMPLKPGFKRPVIVHRAILGSVERFTAVLCEHLGGKWPFWLSPRQVIICPISEKAADYCTSIYLYFHKLGYECEVDQSQGSINKKVRNAQLAQWNYILVAGEDEMKLGLVDVRTRDNKRHGKKRITEVLEMFRAEEPAPSAKSMDMYKNAFNPADYYGEEAGATTTEVSSSKPKAAAAAVVGGAASGSSDRVFSDKLDEMEESLAHSQWLSGAAMPGAADAEALNVLKAGKIPDPRAYPNVFGWYAMVSKFSAEKQAAWK